MQLAFRIDVVIIKNRVALTIHMSIENAQIVAFVQITFDQCLVVFDGFNQLYLTFARCDNNDLFAFFAVCNINAAIIVENFKIIFGLTPTAVCS